MYVRICRFQKSVGGTYFFLGKKDIDAECSSAAEAEIGIDESQKTNGG